ncbi:MAG: hypothetical protein AAB116_08460 [Candidatus Poribacteria bacterium]
MSENSEEKKEIKLKGVIPAKVTTPEEFYRAIDDFREYRRRSSENLEDILEKNQSFLDEIKRDKRRIQVFLTSIVDYLEKHPSILEEIMRESEQKFSREKTNSDF